MTIEKTECDTGINDKSKDFNKMQKKILPGFILLFHHDIDHQLYTIQNLYWINTTKIVPISVQKHAYKSFMNNYWYFCW